VPGGQRLGDLPPVVDVDRVTLFREQPEEEEANGQGDDERW
jgi:hypothetical protein